MWMGAAVGRCALSWQPDDVGAGSGHQRKEIVLKEIELNSRHADRCADYSRGSSAGMRFLLARRTRHATRPRRRSTRAAETKRGTPMVIHLLSGAAMSRGRAGGRKGARGGEGGGGGRCGGSGEGKGLLVLLGLLGLGLGIGLRLRLGPGLGAGLACGAPSGTLGGKLGSGARCQLQTPGACAQAGSSRDGVRTVG